MRSSQSWDSSTQELNFWPIRPIWTVLRKTVRFPGKLGQNSNSTFFFELWRLQVYNMYIYIQYIMLNLNIIGAMGHPGTLFKKKLHLKNHTWRFVAAPQRQAFGSNLNSFGQIQRFIAESYAEYQAEPRHDQAFTGSMLVCIAYPLVNKQFAIENGHRNSGSSH